MADTVIDVGIPALSLVFEGFPADEYVKWGLAFEYGGELGLEGVGCPKALGSAGFVGFGIIGLLLNPVTEVAVGQLLQRGMVSRW